MVANSVWGRGTDEVHWEITQMTPLYVQWASRWMGCFLCMQLSKWDFNSHILLLCLCPKCPDRWPGYCKKMLRRWVGDSSSLFLTAQRTRRDLVKFPDRRVSESKRQNLSVQQRVILWDSVLQNVTGCWWVLCQPCFELFLSTDFFILGGKYFN